MSRSLIPVIVPAVIGCGLAGYAYFADGTGVDGSEGAMLALFGASAVLLGGFLAAFTDRRGWGFGVLIFLIVLGAALTAVAGFFLMQYPLAIIMALTACGAVIVMLRPAPTRRHAS